jgi:hypothetical protein
VADKPKRALGPGAKCCGECDLCAPVAAPAPVVKELDLVDELSGEDK